MSTNLDRQSREILRRLEVRLKALEEGIARHQVRAAELEGIRERVAAEREALLAKEKPAPEPPGEESTPAKSGGGIHAGRAGVNVGPPPEAEPVRESSEQFWPKTAAVAERRPQVVYPWPSGIEGKTSSE